MCKHVCACLYAWFLLKDGKTKMSEEVGRGEQNLGQEKK